MPYAVGAPYQLPPSQRSVSALLSRVSGQRMAAGGTPVQDDLTKAGPAATPYAGDINTYGMGPEHDFFPGGTAPPAATGGGAPSGGGSGGGGSGAGGTGSGGSGARGKNPAGDDETPSPGDSDAAADVLANRFASNPQNANLVNLLKTSGINPQDWWEKSHANSPGFQAPAAAPAAASPYLQQVRQTLGLPGGTQGAAPASQTQPAAQPSGNPLNAYLRGLGNYQQVQARPLGIGATRNMATGGSTDSTDSSEKAVAAPQQNVQQMEQRGEQNQGGPSQGNFTGRDFANANVAVSPSLKSAIGIGAMVAGLAGGPITGALGAATKLGSFDVPGPRLSQDQQDQIAAEQDAALSHGRNLTGLGAVSRGLSGDRAAYGSTPAPGGYGTYGGSNYGTNEISANFTSPGFNGVGVGGGASGSGSASGGGGGSAGGASYGGGDLGGGPGAMGAGRDPNGAPGSFRSGGGVRNYARGGVMRYPSVKRFADGGSSDDDSDAQPQGPPPAVQQAQADAQRNAAYAQPTTAEYIADPSLAYQAMINATRSQAPGERSFTLSVPKRPIPLQSYDDGGSVDSPIDPSIGVGDATPTDQMNGAIGSNWLPLLAGAFQASQGDPASAAASVGVAAAMTGQTPQQAMDYATLLHRSGASNMPKAQQAVPDVGRTSTNQLLAQLAGGIGVADKLAMSAQNPSQAMGTAAKPYARPIPRTRAPANAAAQPQLGGAEAGFNGVQMQPSDQLTPLGQAEGGQMHVGPGHVNGEGDGQEDKIPAMLSDGEFVFDASTVSALGNGSNAAGAKRLDALRQAIRGNAGWKNPKKTQAPIDIAGVIKKMAGGRA